MSCYQRAVPRIRRFGREAAMLSPITWVMLGSAFGNVSGAKRALRAREWMSHALIQGCGGRCVRPFFLKHRRAVELTTQYQHAL